MTVSAAAAWVFGSSSASSARVPRRQVSVDDVLGDGLRQVEQPQRVGDGAARTADALRDVLLPQTVPFNQRAVALRLLHRVEIGSL